MTLDPQLAPTLTAVALILSALFSGLASILSLRNGRKADRISRQVDANTANINAGIADVHRSTNGMKDELVASTARENRAAGVIEGRALEKAGAAPAVVVVVPPAHPAEKAG